jgi:small neutral amino acid transporter SnatA (MarC family)
MIVGALCVLYYIVNYQQDISTGAVLEYTGNGLYITEHGLRIVGGVLLTYVGWRLVANLAVELVTSNDKKQ